MTVFAKTALAAVAVLVATGCGGGGSSFADKSVKDITKQAADDMSGLKSLRIAGDLTTGGQKIHLDMQSTTDGDCQGTVNIGDGSAEIVSSGGDYWMRPDSTFWEQQAPDQADLIEQAVGDKWVSVPANSGLDEVCDLDNFLDSFDKASTDNPSASPSKGGTTSVDGKDAIQVQGKDKDGEDVTAWVATDAPHYILKIEVAGNGTGDTGTLTFSDFDEPVDIKTPDPSEVADLTSLGG
jgi:hypothetical protein